MEKEDKLGKHEQLVAEVMAKGWETAMGFSKAFDIPKEFSFTHQQLGLFVASFARRAVLNSTQELKLFLDLPRTQKLLKIPILNRPIKRVQEAKLLEEEAASKIRGLIWFFSDNIVKGIYSRTEEEVKRGLEIGDESGVADENNPSPMDFEKIKDVANELADIFYEQSMSKENLENDLIRNKIKKKTSSIKARIKKHLPLKSDSKNEE